MSPPDAGSVITVLGVIDPDRLGVTLTHEHVIKDSSDRFPPPAEVSRRAAFHDPLTLENLHRVTYGRFFDVLDNTRLTDDDVAVAELTRFAAEGGGAICELTCEGMNGDPRALARISRRTGVHIVAGAGYYLAWSHPPEVATMTEEQLAAKLVADVASGIGDTGVRAGIFGEIGSSWPLHPDERKVLRAAVAAQQATGVALSIHPSPNEAGPAAVIEVLSECGADLERVVICHMDRCGYELDSRRRLLDAGCFVEYDTFGYHVHPIAAALREGAKPSMLNDVARVRQIAELIDLGYGDQILVSHDTAFKHALTRWGGQGYGHLLANVAPYFEVYGVGADRMRSLLVDNPRRLLTVR